MSTQECKIAAALTVVFSFRMLGLFMVLPVLALYASDLSGATPTRIGLAIGAYGLSQAVLQIPLGWLSDRIGRKPVIVVGLLLFLMGSLAAAAADTIQGVITGRILQGCGAIAGALMALMADLTRDQCRSQAMAMIGIGIGLSFCLAMIIGPVVSHAGGLTSLFASNGLMAIVALAIILCLIPSPSTVKTPNHAINPGCFRTVLGNRQLLQPMAGVFALHFVLMALFVFIPQSLESHASYPRATHGWIYLAVMSASLIVIIPVLRLSERYHCVKQCYMAAIAIMITAIVAMNQGVQPLQSSSLLMIGLLLFFMAFNFLEALLPSLVSKLSLMTVRGTAMGIYSTLQFLGAASGGMLGGWALQYYGLTGVLVVCAIPLLLWGGLAAAMPLAAYATNVTLNTPTPSKVQY